MNNNMIALMASVGAQLKVPKMPESKDKIVKAVCAGVLAASIGTTGGLAHAQEQAPSHAGETAIGAVIGGVGGWAVGKIFGAAPATRNILGAIGAVAGGVVANSNAEAKDAANPSRAAPGATQGGLQPLTASQAEGLTRLQLNALSKRLNYQTAFRQAQEAKLEVQLNVGNPEFEAKMKRAATVMMQAYRQDHEATRNFVSAFETARGMRADLSAYAPTYSKLKQAFDVNDQSYAKLAEQVLNNAKIGAGFPVEPQTESKSESKSSGLSI